MADDPAPRLLAKTKRETQPVRRVVRQVLRSPATEQTVREGDIRARRHIQRDQFEDRTLPLPGKERRPGLAIRLDSPHSIIRWWHVEHHDVVRVVG